jgi:hypothetical protein
VKHLRLVLGLLAGLAVVLGLMAAGSPDVTQARVQSSLDETFTNLYADQQQVLGHPAPTPAAVHTTSTCTRRGGKVAPVGPGSDWVCQVHWTDAGGKPVDGKFELQVHSDACWTASGPASVVGSFTIPDAAGRDVPNPVNAFDGCFDPDGTPAGV